MTAEDEEVLTAILGVLKPVLSPEERAQVAELLEKAAQMLVEEE